MSPGTRDFQPVQMKTVTEICHVRELLEIERRAGKTIGLVPTMGCLHDGHVALIREARKQCDTVVVSVFVNRKQFGPGEDFLDYPRDLPADSGVCQREAVDYLFVPAEDEMYSEEFLTFVEVQELTGGLCGASRPGHFKGVTTVVAKLFNIVRPHKAFFGEKDAQQLLVVKKLVRDLNFDLEVVGVPAVREKDGLAMSSRNKYLDPKERKAAPVLFRSLSLANEKIAEGEREADKVKQAMKELLETEPLVTLEYLSICRTEDLKEIDKLSGDVLVALAARVGKARLIDNLFISLNN